MLNDSYARKLLLKPNKSVFSPGCCQLLSQWWLVPRLPDHIKNKSTFIKDTLSARSNARLSTCVFINPYNMSSRKVFSLSFHTGENRGEGFEQGSPNQ